MIKQLSEVREIQGLYGPLRIPEQVIQRIWAQQDYSEDRLQTLDGRAIRVLQTGSWNHREGPDFLDASLLVGEQPVRGDVEIHFRSRNWREHGHHLDPAFSSVILHVLLFPPHPGEAPAVTSKGGRPPACCLLEAMDCGLEEHAEQEALRRFAGLAATNLSEAFSLTSRHERRSRLRDLARMRWDSKVKWAVTRLSKTSWVDACHQVFLEVLGYPRNRAPMSSIALIHPLLERNGKMPDPDELFIARQGEWKLAGLRPANHPRVRLRQYAELVSARPNWPESAREFASRLSLGGGNDGTAAFRKERKMSLRQGELVEQVFAQAIPKGSLNTWMVDGLLPLVAVETSRDLFDWWFHWFAGHAPDGVARFLKEIGVIGKGLDPISNGWVQGGLGAVTRGVLGGEQIED